jgi:dephospho-CoA kinase
MVKVGITGGIGSGKTTVCKEWEKLGAVVVYADDLAKKLMKEDDKLASEIRNIFGEQSYSDDGSIDRQYLAKEAFEKGRVDELNKLVHPVLAGKIKELIERAEAQGAEMFVEEAALLLNKGRPEIFDFVVIVTADSEKRIGWIKERDGINRMDIMARMKKQKSFEELIPLCDFVLENDSSLEVLRQKARNLYRQILKLQNTGLD